MSYKKNFKYQFDIIELQGTSVLEGYRQKQTRSATWCSASSYPDRSITGLVVRDDRMILSRFRSNVGTDGATF
jgi:hypothetical protein